MESRPGRQIVRQPIIDRGGEVFAYELFFARTTAVSRTESDEGGRLVLPNVTEGRLAFVNMTEEALLSEAVDALPPETTVLEVLETVRPSQEVIRACQRLRARGYSLALDDFLFRPELLPLVELADYIKVELPDATQVRSRVRSARPLRFVAERIETERQLEQAIADGFDLFQGYQTGRPEVVTGLDRQLTDELCNLLGELEDEIPS